MFNQSVLAVGSDYRDDIQSNSNISNKKYTRNHC